MSYRSGRKFPITVQRGTYAGKRRKLAEAAAQIAVSKVAQRSRARGISSASVFQQVSLRPEKKFIDTLTTMSPGVVATGTISGVLNGCAQGTDAVQHIGRQTRMTSLYWLLEASMAATSVGSSPLRLVILYDKEAEGAPPTIAAGVQTDAFNADNILAQMNLNNRDRFITLVDECIECLGTGGPQSQFRKGYRKVQLPCVFNASAAGTIAAINTGSIFAFCWQNGGITTAGPIVQLQTRIRFEDA